MKKEVTKDTVGTSSIKKKPMIKGEPVVTALRALH